MKLEHLDAEYDFDTEFSSLTNMVLTYFNSQSLSIVDLQKEFEMAVQDEDLVNAESEEKEDEDMAVITTVEETANQVKTPLTSPIKIRIPTKQIIDNRITVGYVCMN